MRFARTRSEIDWSGLNRSEISTFRTVAAFVCRVCAICDGDGGGDDDVCSLSSFAASTLAVRVHRSRRTRVRSRGSGLNLCWRCCSSLNYHRLELI